MKYEWRKKEKEIYLPKSKPEIITLPSFKYFSIKGEGNPNNPFFGECIGSLYSLSYAIRMSYKNGYEPDDFYEYTVYPLEGVWDINEEAKRNYKGVLDKDSLVFNLMIRQPDFVTNDFAQKTFERTMKKKPSELLKNVEFSEIEEGKCVQMMHLGSYDDEPGTFKLMETFCKENKFIRKSKKHREIYISDPRKIKPEKLKTVLRFKIKT
ncbi:MAG: GyrI-like domain-containing protein [Candidatus Aureabacteria bacterium]|nr:GyrI-like domain-containing protein [Candidatus Auribacterota bacterium]